MMKIGIDIDGVLTDVEQWQLDYGSKYYYEKYGMRIKNYKGYEVVSCGRGQNSYTGGFITACTG